MLTFYVAIGREETKIKLSFSYVLDTSKKFNKINSIYTKHYAITSTLAKLGGTNWLQILNCENAFNIFVGEFCSSNLVGELEQRELHYLAYEYNMK